MPTEIDPMISYCLVIADDNPYKTSPFQGFSPGLVKLRWAMTRLTRLPADVIEPALPHQAVLARRIAGTGGWRWFPLSLEALSQLSISESAPFWVLFSETESVAIEVSNWALSQILPPLHITPAPHDDSIAADDLTPDILRAYVESTVNDLRQKNGAMDLGLVRDCLSNWSDRPRIDAPLPMRAHNCTLPNHMVLETAGLRFNEKSPLFGDSIEEYVSAIRESTDAVIDIRDDVGDVPAFRLTPPQPSLILTAPALYHHAYRKAHPSSNRDDSESQAVRRVLRFMQRQKTYHWSVSTKDQELLFSSEKAHQVMEIRRGELDVHTLAVGLRAASTIAATIRLPPAINRTAGVVRQIATYERNSRIYRPQKFARLFSVVQKALTGAVGADLLETIGENKGGVKLVTDAPIEWLPIGNLPLSLRFDCSRTTATPGNLMLGELCGPRILRFRTDAFWNVLIVSAFSPTDPVRKVLPRSLTALRQPIRDTLRIRFAEVNNELELCETLNSYDGCILIFDGHGQHSEDTGEGTLAIGDDRVNVWTLRGRVRVPPIVILSACDTQAADRSHVTTANGFLASGARTVLGTLLPVGADHAALFIVRLLYRLCEFLPAALETRNVAVQWSEVISGMLRMQLLTDLLLPYHNRGFLTKAQYEDLHLRGNVAINERRSDWFDLVQEWTANLLSQPIDRVSQSFQSRIANSDTIRYIQMGDPESILIDDPLAAERLIAQFQEPN